MLRIRAVLLSLLLFCPGLLHAADKAPYDVVVLRDVLVPVRDGTSRDWPSRQATTGTGAAPAPAGLRPSRVGSRVPA